MASHSFSLDKQATKDIAFLRIRMKERGKKPSASAVVKVALSDCVASVKARGRR